MHGTGMKAAVAFTCVKAVISRDSWQRSNGLAAFINEFMKYCLWRRNGR